ncbi:hypothetical protein [Nonomuraea recticatena]|uniref:Uncharacterized protein n=1 Tax=Nonomuraea recticatena TaxID=46178 RepID=A0ABN3T9V1_9ACTN
MSLMAAELLSLETCLHDPGLDPHHVPEGTGERPKDGTSPSNTAARRPPARRSG